MVTKAKTPTAATGSRPHYHDLDSSCLEPIPAVPLYLGRLGEVWASGDDKGKLKPTVPVGPGWFRCKEREAYYVHDHAGHFVSHYPRSNDGCPSVPA